MISSPFSLACSNPREERWWLSHCQLGSMTLRSSKTHQFCLVCSILGIGYCMQDVTSGQCTNTGDGGGNARNLEEAEVVWKELLSQEWTTAGPAVLFPEWKASIPTASFRSSPPKAPAMENCVLSGPALVTTLSLAGDLPSLSPSASPSHTVK